MHIQAKVQKWGNSSAVRLPLKVLAASGIQADSEIDIEASDGRIVIKLKPQSPENALDKFLADSPEIAELMALVRENLAKAITTTVQATQAVEEARAQLSKSEIK